MPCKHCSTELHPSPFLQFWRLRGPRAWVALPLLSSWWGLLAASRHSGGRHVVRQSKGAQPALCSFIHPLIMNGLIHLWGQSPQEPVLPSNAINMRLWGLSSQHMHSGTNIPAVAGGLLTVVWWFMPLAAFQRLCQGVGEESVTKGIFLSSWWNTPKLLSGLVRHALAKQTRTFWKEKKNHAYIIWTRLHSSSCISVYSCY